MDALSRPIDMDSIAGVMEFLGNCHLSRTYDSLLVEYKNGFIDRNTFIRKAVVSGSYRSSFETLEQFARHLCISRSHVHRIVNGRCEPSNHIPGEGVYFLKCGELVEFVKIGWTKNLGRRIECIQVSNPQKVTLLLFDTQLSRKYEKRLHKKFYQFHKQGEWFVLSEEIKAYIESRSCSCN